MPDQDDELLFADESEEESTQVCERTWRILVVDDDQDVHDATMLVLRNALILNRPLEVLHAYSATEARQLLAETPDIAVILLDVVMESDDAGLQLVDYIRRELRLEEVRIILRTGQPGQAPELEVIRDYDINDYKTKTELTRHKLLTTLIAAVRSYEQIQAINASRRGLDLIVRASTELNGEHGLQAFSAGVITQLSGLLSIPPEGLICAKNGSSPTHPEKTNFYVIAAAGRYAPLISHTIDEIGNVEAREDLRRALQERRNIYSNHGTALFFPGQAGQDMAAFVEAGAPHSKIDLSLLEVFCANIVVCLDNIQLFEQLNSYAFYDQLLRLPNRVHFIAELDKLLASSDKNTMLAALVDIDHFGEINNALGHRFGDMLLQVIAERLRASLSERCLLARVAGDAFGLLGPKDEIDPKTIQLAFQTPFMVDGNEMRISASIGLVNLEEVNGKGADAFMDASLALKQIKTAERGRFAYYSHEMDLEIRERVRLLQELRVAFDKERLFLAYQPQVNLADGRPVGVEALLRWRGDDGLFVPPDRFIPLAENSGLIVPLGMWILRYACHEQVRLIKAGLPRLRMAVNVSVIQFRHPHFLEMLDNAIADSGINPADLELEITESVAMHDPQTMVRLLDDIHRRGVAIAIDDFGTGFSSLSYLQQLKVDRLKIDRAFVEQLLHDGHNGHSIAETVINLAKNIGLSVIAEGVEEQKQVEILQDFGCNEAQGYYYARPMEISALRVWLQERA